ncbi:hypothetical protein CVT25_001861 [Psilocybe cyanescens]|uniref:Hydrophobin n=1 Tax=Psilocybe cyanescens TaxID=93625 RepID=A0A409WQI2_PSICY|nr:hypothetical protein CVT25_001861 [Psilocybe cyanescens]
MYPQSTKATLIVILGLVASMASANPIPELEQRTTCSINYVPACCSYIQYVSWPNVVPGNSGGCVSMASEPGGVCPTSGASTSGCCQEAPLTHGQLYYHADRTVYCYVP